MPLQQPQPLGGLATLLSGQSERLRALEQKRLSSPGGIALGAAATFVPNNTVLNNPTGWDYTFTVGPTGVVVAFAQVSAVVSFSSADILLGLRFDGSPAFLMADGIANTHGVLPTFGQTVFAGLVPEATHTLQIAVSTDLSSGTGTTTISDAFIVAWTL